MELKIFESDMLKNKSNCDSAIMIILFKNRSSEDTGILDVVAALEVFLGKPEIIHYLFPKYQDASLSVNISRDCQVHSNRVLNKLVCPSGKY